MTLDFNPPEFRALLHETVDRVADFYEGLPNAPLFHDKSPREVKALFDGPLPSLGTPPGELLALATQNLLSATSLNASPNFYAYVISGGNQMSVLAEVLRSGIRHSNKTPGIDSSR